MSDRDWVEVFTREFDQPESAVQARIWADVLGDEYPAELAPYSYTTRSEVQFMADHARRRHRRCAGRHRLRSRRIGAISCQQATGARYVGVDIAASALDAVAQTRPESSG